MYAMASDGKYLSVYTLLRNEDYIRFLRRSKFKKFYSCRRGHIMQSLPGLQATNKQPQRATFVQACIQNDEHLLCFIVGFVFAFTHSCSR
jgi:hypothetical protein